MKKGIAIGAMILFGIVAMVAIMSQPNETQSQSEWFRSLVASKLIGIAACVAVVLIWKKSNIKSYIDTFVNDD